MNYQFSLNTIIGDINSSNYNPVMQSIISQLIEKVNQSPIVMPENKHYLNQFFSGHLFGAPRITRPSFSKQMTLNKNDMKNILVAFAAYYLTDLNVYDYKLINYLFAYGMKADDIIALLLMNNIYDIELFCQQKGIIGDRLHTIITLKKLSAFHKVQYNF